MRKTYLVTGGAGFIGSHVVDRVIASGNDCIVIDDLSTGLRENVNRAARFIQADVSEIPKQIFDTQDVKLSGIFHLAARARIQPSFKDPVGYDKANVHGTVNILELARHHACKVVFSSSSSVYGKQPETMLPYLEGLPPDPKNPYALQKLIGEMYCRLYTRAYDVPVAVLRYFNVYGERQIPNGAYATVISVFMDQFKRGVPFTIVDDGQQRRDFTYVGDVADANMLAMFSHEVGIFNIGRGKNYSVNEIADAIDKNHARERGIKREGEVRQTLAENFKARSILGWEPKIDVIEWIQRSMR